MGRKRTKDKDLPARVYLHHGAFFFVAKDGKWTKLGTTKADAMRAYADLLQGSATSFAALAERYRTTIMPRKSPRTQAEQARQLDRLIAVFGKMPADSIRRGMVAQYRDMRPPVAANRELALLSHIFARGMEWEAVKENPCTSVERNKEKPRQRYVTDDEFIAVAELAPVAVRAAMILALVTGQREGDLLRLRRQSVTPQGIEFAQGKTGKRLMVQWTDALKYAVEEALALPRASVASTYLIVKQDGQPYSSSGFQTAWQRFIRDCMAKGVITERFTFHDIRAKAGSEGSDARLLGHSDERLMNRVYRRTAEKVRPAR